MARKDVMKGLMGDTVASPNPPSRVDAAKPRYTKGAIGAVSRSIDDLKRRAVIEIDPKMIDGAGLKDRLDVDDPDLSVLIASIKTYGQQVPVLVRVNPNDAERYQVVYGRRRVAALRALGRPVKALIRDLDDQELVLAQGQENSARKDLTFIEKANFARQMLDAGYERKVIGDALAMDKTLISRLLSVTDKLPVRLIEAIGSAPSVGRDRWLSLAEKYDGKDLTALAIGATSDGRFEAVMRSFKPARAAPPQPELITSEQGGVVAEVLRKSGKTVLTLSNRTSAGFDEWLVENMSGIHRDWAKQRGE
jgi:ParB family chromosome partitioning protein